MIYCRQPHIRQVFLLDYDLDVKEDIIRELSLLGFGPGSKLPDSYIRGTNGTTSSVAFVQDDIFGGRTQDNRIVIEGSGTSVRQLLETIVPLADPSRVVNSNYRKVPLPLYEPA